MHNAIKWLLALAVAGAALGGGLWLGSAQRQQSMPAPSAANALLAAQFVDLAGNRVDLTRWRGQIVVVNFWATWCPPCREEIPGLMDVQKRLGPTGVQVVGIAIDSADKTREYAANMGINYAIVLGSMASIDLVKELGNKAAALPFTVVLNRNGEISGTHLGLMSVEQIEAAVRAAAG
jgi:thiol-disulfide isomerase/thioredoxin